MTATHQLTVSYDHTPGQRFVLVATREGAAARFVVPQRFTAATTRDGVRIGLTIEVDDQGVARCTGLQLHQEPEGEPISGETLRSIPVARLMREAIAEAASSVPTPAELDLATARVSVSGSMTVSTGTRTRGAPLKDEHLRNVAERYRAALVRGVSPTLTVANELGAPRSTAARWVAAARKRGMLGPAMRGRAGEAS